LQAATGQRAYPVCSGLADCGAKVA